MKRSIVCIGIVVILSAATIFLFFRALDAGMEVDSLKSEIRLKNQEMHFLQSKNTEKGG